MKQNQTEPRLAPLMQPSELPKPPGKQCRKWLRAAAICGALMLFGIWFGACGDQPAQPEGQTGPQETTCPTETLPVQAEWSACMDELPAYVTEDLYEIEQRILYRTSALETTTSTETDKLDGWELYDTISEAGTYGPWSEWSADEVTASDTRMVEIQTRYRYRTKETTTGSSSTKSGWELYDTTYGWGDYGSWSEWSASVVSASDTREVKAKTQYRYRDKLTAEEYSDWSAFSDTAYTPSATREVQTRTVYRYRDREQVLIYHFCRWGSWSAWSDHYVEETDSRDVEIASYYRYCDQITETTYCFRRWKDWSDFTAEAVTGSDTLRVEVKTQYRFKSKDQ